MNQDGDEESKSVRKKKTDYRDKDDDPNGSMGIARGRVEDPKQSRRQRQQDMEKRQLKEGDSVKKYYPEAPTQFASKKIVEKRRKHRKKVTASLERHETKRYEAAVAAADAEAVLNTESAGLLEIEHEMERTTALTQARLKLSIPNGQQKIYDLKLEAYAPYGMKYDRSGRCAVLFGQSGGHVALMDCRHPALQTEFHLRERVRDACFLHNWTMMAVAQKNHVYIYDNTGAEIHHLEKHVDPFAIDFLPYHWLLASVGRTGIITYQDTSTGQFVSEHKTKLGPSRVLRQNKFNAVLHCGHKNGVVTLWSPASSGYLVKMLCHKGASVLSLAVDGDYMVTGGADRQVKIWDLRTYKELHAYHTAAGVPTSLDISQRGILGVGHAGHATFFPQIKTKVKDPYMYHAMPRCDPVETLRFRPYEDICGIGHSKGISSIVIPGSGEPNVDTAEYNTNPDQDLKQRREEEVRALLDKLSPETIALDPNIIGSIEEDDQAARVERLRAIEDKANAKKKKEQPTKKRGRSKIQTQLRRKHKNIVDQATIKLREAREKEEKEKQNPQQDDLLKEQAPAALKRFF